MTTLLFTISAMQPFKSHQIRDNNYIVCENVRDQLSLSIQETIWGAVLSNFKTPESISKGEEYESRDISKEKQ